MTNAGQVYFERNCDCFGSNECELADCFDDFLGV